MRQSWQYLLKSFWLSPWFIALPVALAVIFFLPDVFKKYTLEIVKSGPVHKPGGFEYYDDRDGDGNSEQIVLFNDSEGKAAVKILDHKGFIADHFYFTGKIVPKSGSLVAGPYGPTGQRGIFLLTKSNDSILLQGISPTAANKTLFHDQLLTCLEAGNAENDYTLGTMLLADLDRDGTKEIITGVMAGFQAKPRFLFTYDLNSSKLKKTPPAVVIQGITDTTDLDGDGFPELTGPTYSIDNNQGRFNIPFDDDSAWLIVYNRDLEFFFPPVGFPGKYIVFETVVTKRFGKPYLFALQDPKAKGTGTPKLMLFNASGKFIRERTLDCDPMHENHYLIRSDELEGRIFLLHEQGILEEIDTNLQVVGRRVVKEAAIAIATPMDVDGDGRMEYLFWGDESAAIIVTEPDFSNPVAMNNPFGRSGLHFQSIREKGKRAKLYVQGENQRVICAYEPNPLYYFRFPAYVTVYLFIVGFVMLAQYLQRRRTRQLVDARKKISEMQLLLLNQQLDPHFTFNAINTISASIMDEKPEEANRNLMSLSRLMRSFVRHTDTLSRTLAEELDFLQNYLTLMHSRMKAIFAYQIEIGEEVDLNVEVPRMIVQIFAENAVKHGLKPLNEGGNLKVSVHQRGDRVTIDIRDNGIGRKEAGRSGEHGTGKGMAIIDQTVKIINQFNQKKIGYQITDLEDDRSNPAGTLVSITIPVGMNYCLAKS